MPLRESPGLVLCAIFTLRFSAVHPAVGGNTTALGVDRLGLYHDEVQYVVAHLSDRHSEVLSALREHDNWITLYSAASLNVSGEIQTQQIAHCNVEALVRNASWAANWDGRVAARRARSLAARAWGSDGERVGLQINRVEFGAPQTLELPPLHLLEPEVQTIEIYAQKRGKTMWQADPSLGTRRARGHPHRQHWADALCPGRAAPAAPENAPQPNASCTIALELLPRLRIQFLIDARTGRLCSSCTSTWGLLAL